MKKGFQSILLILTLLVSFNSWGYSEKIYKELSKFARVLEIVDKHYVSEPNEKELVEGAIKGLLYSLDPHTVYLPTELYKDFKSDTKGRFGGVGIEVTAKDGFINVVSPLEGSPAQKAGIRSGDKILMINNKITKGMDLTEAVHLMRGTVGSKVTLSIWRPGLKQARLVSLTRDVIKVASVITENLGEGYVLFRITSFQEGTSKALRKAMSRFQKDNGKIKGLILDLRDNPGGLLSEAVRVSDLFIEKGVIVSTKGRESIQDVKSAKKPGTFAPVPMVTMINNGSASASEIVAGALQDLGRAKLVGTKSYGKGSVQTVINLDDGDAVKITVARYFTPKNRMIDGKGINPDVVVGKKEYEKWRKSTKANSKPTREEYVRFQRDEALHVLRRL